MTTKGLRCFSFDYRGFGKSGGVKGFLRLEDEVTDVRAAVSYVRESLHVEKNHIGLIGWAMGAGVSLKAAYHLGDISFVCGLNGFYDGWRFLHFHRGDAGMREFEKRVHRACRIAAKNGEWPYAEAFDIYPLDRSSGNYVDEYLKKYDLYFNHKFSMAFADSLLAWKPEALAPEMKIPLWLAHGSENKLHSIEETDRLYDCYAGEKQRVYLPNAGHTEWLHDDHPTFLNLADQLHAWITTKFV